MDDEFGCNVPFRFGYCEGYNDPEDDSTSSEDELDIILHGTPEQKRKLSRSLSRGSLQLSSSEDDFEKEMETELDMTMKKHEMQFMAGVRSRLSAERDSQSLPMTTNPPTNKESQTEMGEAVRPAATPQERTTVQQFYDDIYFDSDDEDGEGKARTAKDGGESSATDTKKDKKQKRRIPTNDELLYDPNIDDDNQNWMNKQRAHYYPRKNKKPVQSSASSGNESNDAASANEEKQEPSNQASDSKITLPKTDAILNCPACMTTLCIDCQRHELYANQFRAMFVVNCCIVRNEQLRYPVSKKKRRWRKKRKHDEDENESEAGTSSDELYNPVKCSVCNTEVAVFDKDDVFHFFNVLSSAA